MVSHRHFFVIASADPDAGMLWSTPSERVSIAFKSSCDEHPKMKRNVCPVAYHYVGSPRKIEKQHFGQENRKALTKKER